VLTLKKIPGQLTVGEALERLKQNSDDPELQELVSDELIELGLKVLYVTTPPPEDDSDKLLYGVKGLFAEYERARIAERFRLGKFRKARDWNVVTSQAPYGYDYIPKQGSTQGYYKINKQETAVVKMIFQWIAVDHITLRETVRRIHDLAITPRKSKRGLWNTSTLTNLLINETYIGNAYYNKSFAVIPENHLNKSNIKESKKRVENLNLKRLDLNSCFANYRCKHLLKSTTAT